MENERETEKLKERKAFFFLFGLQFTLEPYLANMRRKGFYLGFIWRNWIVREREDEERVAFK
jgi:hypothetical protein